MPYLWCFGGIIVAPYVEANAKGKLGIIVFLAFAIVLTIFCELKTLYKRIRGKQ